jgi:hypothetical protein
MIQDACATTRIVATRARVGWDARELERDARRRYFPLTRMELSKA